jgi:isoquinoline 1-oxidoreductase beta subunit
MSRIGKIARRTFLIGSAAIAGGVAFGVYMVRRPVPTRLRMGWPRGPPPSTPGS